MKCPKCNHDTKVANHLFQKFYRKEFECDACHTRYSLSLPPVYWILGILGGFSYFMLEIFQKAFDFDMTGFIVFGLLGASLIIATIDEYYIRLDKYEKREIK